MENRETGYYKAILKDEYEWTIIYVYIDSDGGEHIMFIGSEGEHDADDVEEFGEKIEIGGHVHRWDRILARSDDVTGYGVVYMCKCGAKLLPEMDNYHEEAMRMQKYRSTPGAVFEVVER